jgi:hypothetical protein
MASKIQIIKTKNYTIEITEGKKGYLEVSIYDLLGDLIETITITND